MTAGVLMAVRASAQVRAHLVFTTAQGLAGDNVYGIQQDNNGFIWIATETGVSRFDGTSFKTFITKDGLPGNDIPWLLADSKNRILPGKAGKLKR